MAWADGSALAVDSASTSPDSRAIDGVLWSYSLRFLWEKSILLRVPFGEDSLVGGDSVDSLSAEIRA